jgi:hypothetical protein
MKTPIEPSQVKLDSPATSTNSTSFDFEGWAKQVRPQLIASVQKRGNK